MYITIENNSIVVCLCISRWRVGNELIKNYIFIHGISKFFDVAIIWEVAGPAEWNNILNFVRGVPPLTINKKSNLVNLSMWRFGLILE